MLFTSFLFWLVSTSTFCSSARFRLLRFRMILVSFEITRSFLFFLSKFCFGSKPLSSPLTTFLSDMTRYGSDLRYKVNNHRTYYIRYIFPRLLFYRHICIELFDANYLEFLLCIFDGFLITWPHGYTYSLKCVAGSKYSDCQCIFGQ